MTLFEGLFDHQGRCLNAEGGNPVPMILSISPNVMGMAACPDWIRWSASGSYFDTTGLQNAVSIVRVYVV